MPRGIFKKQKAKTKKAGKRATKRTRRIRRTFRDLFLEKLAELSGGEQKLIGNGKLREELGWPEDKYLRIKRELIESSAIISGRGQGGSIALANAPGSSSLKIFLSYSHADETFKVELLKHLEPLRRLGLVESWHDRKLKPGQNWEKEISDQLVRADIILILVSIDFVNSEYCYDIELEKALEQEAAGKARVIPIILRNCLWQHTSFARLQALPTDGRAIASWPDRDEAFARIAESVRSVAQELASTR